jgi:HK97 family phage portal protein
MSIASNILKKFGYYKRSTTSNPSQWFIDWIHGGAATSSGVNVSESSAMKYTPFWAAVRIITSTIASLPFMVYSRRADGGKDQVKNHRVYSLLHDRPNEYMDAITFLESRQAHVLTYGNGYAEIQRDGAGRPIALWPLQPDMTERKIKDGVPYYEVRLPVGGTVELPDYNVLHIKGLGFDGYTGYNVVSYHKEAIGYGVAVKEYGARFFSNDGSPGGVLEHPEMLSDTAKKHLEDSWNTSHSGLKQAHRVAILEEGMQWKQQGVDPKQAQALEVQKYTVDDCSMDRATFNNIEEQNLKFLAMTMLYWFRKWEQECNYKLFMPSEKKTLFCEILVDALLRGSIKARYEAYNIGRNGGWLCVDDIREKENMNPLPDGKGKIFLEPLNMKEAGKEPPEKEPEEDIEDLRHAYREWFKVQWYRIIKTQIKALEKKNGFDYGRQRDYAKTLLTDPFNAWAEHNNLSKDEANKRLQSVINLNINERRSFELSDAEKMADVLMDRIGGNNAIT